MYAKLFTSIYQGTLRGNSHGLLVFTNLLAHADSAGHVDIHPRAIADEVGLPLKDVQAALDLLSAPDLESRTPDEEGRRIVLLNEHRNWGWRIVNHAKYRAIRNEEDRREQNRLAQEKWRSKQSKPHKPPSAHTETDTEAEPETDSKAQERKDVAQGSIAPDAPPVLSIVPAKPKKARQSDEVMSASAETWIAYRNAYATRYKVDPVRNAKVNGQLSQLVKRLGDELAPKIAAHYLTSNARWYIQTAHSVDSMLKDAEKLAMEYQTGNRVTSTSALQADKTQTNRQNLYSAAVKLGMIKPNEMENNHE